MITTYIFILTFSAWLMAFILSFLAGRLTKAASLPLAHAHGVIALVVAVGFLIAAAAPGWVMVVALVLMAVPPLRSLPIFLPWMLIPAALLPLLITPLMGAPSWVALDSAILAASILGAAQARGVESPLGRAALPYAWLVGWLTVSALMHIGGLSHAA
jgi:hypothetical protein